MIHNLVRKWFTWTSREQFLPLFDLLYYLGKPAPVQFPPELIDQGLGLVLSGLSNTFAFQSHHGWIWPWWAMQQQNPESPYFLPTGVNVLTVNLTARNWVSLGVEGHSSEVMVDPVGMLSMGPFLWSCFSYLKMGQHTHVPLLMEQSQVKQNLIDAVGPGVCTEYLVDPNIRWRVKVQTVLVSGRVAVIYDVEIENRSESVVELTLGHTLRPYNNLTLGPIHKLKFKKDLWRINRQSAVYLSQSPTRVHIANRNGQDPLFQDFKDENSNNITFKSQTGILSGQSEWDVQLAIGEIQKFRHIILVPEASAGRLQFYKWKKQHFEVVEWDALILEQKASLKDLLSQSGRVKAPSQNSDQEFSTSQVFQSLFFKINAFDDGFRMTPGTYFYHEHWIRDSFFMLNTLMKLGLWERVRPKIITLQKTQMRNGFYKSHHGEWDSAGQAMVLITTFYRGVGEYETLEKLMPSLLKGVQWILDQRQISHKKNDNPLSENHHKGMLPAGFSAEHFGPNDHYFWDNFWALAGIERVILALEYLEENKGYMASAFGMSSQNLREKQNKYVYDLQLIIQRLTERWGGVLPASPYRKPDSACIGNLIVLTPLSELLPILDLSPNSFPYSKDWVYKTTQFLAQNFVKEGLFFQKIIHTGFNIYLTCQVAKNLIIYNDRLALKLIEAILSAGNLTHTWPEAIHPQTRGGCMGDGDHGWATFEVLDLLLSQGLIWTADELILAAMWPENWYKSEKIEYQNILTPWGKLSLKYDFVNEGGLLRLIWIEKLSVCPKITIRLLNGWSCEDMGEGEYRLCFKV